MYILVFDQSMQCEGVWMCIGASVGGTVPAWCCGSPGQVAVLLQSRVSLSGPLQRVPYGEDTHERERTCQPCPQVSEHTLHWDHSSAAGSPTKHATEREKSNAFKIPDTGWNWRKLRNKVVKWVQGGCAVLMPLIYYWEWIEIRNGLSAFTIVVQIKFFGWKKERIYP